MKQVKKLTRIFLVLTLGLIYSCSSDDDSTPDSTLTNAELIIGSWTWTEQSENGVVVDDLTECQLMETFIYDGTQVEQIDYSGTPCTQTFTSTENYAIDGNMITFSAVDDPTDSYTDEILELNATTLRMKYEETYDGETFILIDTYTRVE
ncbi:MAG TPA: lipocalin family protein [Aquaticitalea sp.]|nr:lipocalin family protein [Aquaticitalea sp.]